MMYMPQDLSSPHPPSDSQRMPRKEDESVLDDGTREGIEEGGQVHHRQSVFQKSGMDKIKERIANLKSGRTSPTSPRHRSDSSARKRDSLESSIKWDFGGQL